MARATKKSRLAKEQRAKHPTNFTTVLHPSSSIDGPDNHDPGWEESSSDESEDQVKILNHMADGITIRRLFRKTWKV